MSDDFDEIFQENGDFTQQRFLSDEERKLYAGKIPDLLLEIWEKQGIGNWANGCVRLCIPSDYSDVLELIFQNDTELSADDCYIYLQTAFGQLYFWSERHWHGKINLLDNTIEIPDLLYPEQKYNADDTLALNIMIDENEKIDFYDEDNKALYARALKKLGPLAPDECFGFAPALALGGAPVLENVRKFPALEHFSFLAQLQPFTLMDYLARPIQAVRQIGNTD